MEGGLSGKEVDVALVVVHGIGQQAARQTLYSWAEPLAEELEAICRARHNSGIEITSVIDDSVSGGRVLLTVPTNNGLKRIAITEARWADAFLTMTRAEVVKWIIAFVPRAMHLSARHLWRLVMAVVERSRTLADLGASIAGGGLRHDARLPGYAGHPALFFLAGGSLTAMLGLGVAAAALLTALVIGTLLPLILSIGALGLLLTLLLSYLPLIGSRVRPALMSLTNTLGDASVWTSHPVRAAAMRDIVRAEVNRARETAHQVVLLGHSQGAAVSAGACLGAGRTPVEVLVTVGGATQLLQQPQFRRSRAHALMPLAQWAGDPNTRWINAWAIWDPVPSGPVAESSSSARRRWAHTSLIAEAQRGMEALEQPASADPPPKRTGGVMGAILDFYNLQERDNKGFGIPWAESTPEEVEVRKPAEDAAAWREDALRRLSDTILSDSADIGPEEWPLHNRASLFTDHVTYTTNTEQLIPRLALLLLNPNQVFVHPTLPDSGTEERGLYEREKRYTTMVRAIGMYKLVCLPAGALTSLAFLTPWIGQALNLSAMGVGKLGDGPQWAWRLLSSDKQTWVLYALSTILVAGLLSTGVSSLSRWGLQRRWGHGLVVLAGLVTSALAVMDVLVLRGASWLLIAIPAAIVLPLLACGPSRCAAIPAQRVRARIQ